MIFAFFSLSAQLCVSARLLRSSPSSSRWTLNKPAGSADPSDCEQSELLSEGDGARAGGRLPLACSAAAPSRLRHALSSVQLLMLLHREQDAHFAAVVIANSLEGALLRVSLVTS